MRTPRRTSVKREVEAGCYECHGDQYKAGWTGGNAQGVAARHTDSTGHKTWVHVEMNITYRREG